MLDVVKAQSGAEIQVGQWLVVEKIGTGPRIFKKAVKVVSMSGKRIKVSVPGTAKHSYLVGDQVIETYGSEAAALDALERVQKVTEELSPEIEELQRKASDLMAGRYTAQIQAAQRQLWG